MLVVAVGAAADPTSDMFEEARKAYERNDYQMYAWLTRRLAEQGYPTAQIEMGVLSSTDNKFLPKDYAMAARWFRLAANQGHGVAQRFLGLSYFRGQGVPQDDVLAFMWLSLAANNKVNLPKTQIEVMEARDGLARRMTQAQLEEAQKLARQCLQSNYRDCDRVTVVARRENNPASHSVSANSIPMKKDGGTLAVPVEINGIITLDFVVDSGAAHVTVPVDVFLTLRRKGTIKDSDIIGTEKYAMADGSEAQMASFMIKSLKVGSVVVENVRGSVAPVQGSLLLGQSFLERFKSWSIDNTKKELLLEPQ
jgi:clan AA aspartic protease (TIGR02281 family)